MNGDQHQDWQSVQKQYLELLLGMTPGFAAAGNSAGDPATGPLAGMLKGWNTLFGERPGPQTWADWLEVFNQRSAAPTADTEPETLEAQLRQSAEHWAVIHGQLLTSLLGTREPGESLQAFSRQWQSSLRDCWQHWRPEDLQRGLELWQELERARLAYRGLLEESARAATSCFQEKLPSYVHQEHNKRVLREVYDTWVECQEEAWLATIRTDQYARDYAALVNASLALQQHLQLLVSRAPASGARSPEPPESASHQDQDSDRIAELELRIQELTEQLQKYSAAGEDKER